MLACSLSISCRARRSEAGAEAHRLDQGIDPESVAIARSFPGNLIDPFVEGAVGFKNSARLTRFRPLPSTAARSISMRSKSLDVTRATTRSMSIISIAARSSYTFSMCCASTCERPHRGWADSGPVRYPRFP